MYVYTRTRARAPWPVRAHMHEVEKLDEGSTVLWLDADSPVLWLDAASRYGWMLIGCMLIAQCSGWMLLAQSPCSGCMLIEQSHTGRSASSLYHVYARQSCSMITFSTCQRWQAARLNADGGSTPGSSMGPDANDDL
jgi:hypothetical protein